MSRKEFDRLFTDIGITGPTELRTTLPVAIANSLVAMQRAKQLLARVSFDNREPLHDTAHELRTLEIWRLKGSPVRNTVADLLAPYQSATTTYAEACEQRRGALRRKDQPTEAEVLALKKALEKVVDDMTTWLKKIQP